MAKVLRLPKFMGGGPRLKAEPSTDWDEESEVIKAVGAWLAQLENPEARFRVLAYWMWREKSGDSPKIANWVENTMEECAVTVAGRHGFKGGDE